MAAILGGDALIVWPKLLKARPLTLVRYFVSAILTLAGLVARRPRAVVVTNPPVFAALSVGLYCLFTKTPFVQDAHPVAFGAKNNRVGQLMLPLTRAVAKRAALNVVTTQQWVDVLERWGARGAVVHEAPPEWKVSPANPIQPGVRPQVLLVGIFASDEPIAVAVEAMRSIAEVDLSITGAFERCPPGLREGAPTNVRFTGFLSGDDYVAAIEQADIVLALTTEPTSVMRAACEAVYAQRPLVVSDTAVARETFPFAVYVRNEAVAVADGIQSALSRHDELCESAPAAKARQESRWNDQLKILHEALGKESL